MYTSECVLAEIFYCSEAPDHEVFVATRETRSFRASSVRYISAGEANVDVKLGALC
jgi:hypothetical protein